MKKIEKYLLPTGKDWTTQHVDNLELIYREGKQALEADLDYFQRLRDRAFNLIRILIPTVSLLLAFFLKDDIMGTTSPSPSPEVWWTLALLSGSLTACCVVLTWKIRSVPMQPKGYEPRFLVRPYFLYDTDTYQLSEEQRRVMMLRNMIETYQRSISLNRPKVKACNRLVNNSILWILLSLTVAGVSLLAI